MPLFPNLEELAARMEAVHAQDVEREERKIALLQAILDELKRGNE